MILHFRKIFLFSFLTFLFWHCSEDKKTNGISYDLVHELNQTSTLSNGIPNISDPIPYHWKKNPGRQSALPVSRKWENTQITFNTDKNLFINHSLDSIYFPPKSSYTFKLKNGNYQLKGMLGFLNSSPQIKLSSGTLKFYADGKEVFSQKFNNSRVEIWNPINQNISINSEFKVQWESESDHLFFAEPLLYENNHSKKPNVILIVLDSARKDFFGTYGFPYQITPQMDALAKESIVFQNPFSNGNWTKPSMMSFFHSEYSSNLGLGNSWFTTKPYQRKVYYGKKRPNLTNILRENGYYTKSIMNNVFFLDYTTVGIDLGFHNTYQVGMDILDTEELTNHALEFVQNMNDTPFFLHLNLNTPHASYAPPAEDMSAVKKIIPNDVFYKYESPVQRYIGEMHYTDREVGRLIQKLKDLRIYDDTLIILTGDHGELFSPHHDYSYHFIMKTRFGHGETHYDEEINVPYFIKLPKTLTAEKNLIKGQSSLLSLLPTTLGLLGIPQIQFHFKGLDYSDCILNSNECPKEDMIYTEGRMSESVRTEKYKYIRRYPGFTTVSRKADGELHSMPEELYLLDSDPEEKINLSTSDSSKEILTKVREDFHQGKFLDRNHIQLRIPICSQIKCRDSLSINLQGSIYDWFSPVPLNVSGSSAKTFNFELESTKQPVEISIATVNPELEGNFQFFRNGQAMSHRLGRWGIETISSNHKQAGDFILSDRKPIGWETSELPWVYNDGFFSGTTESNVQREMGKEVKKILETWGYIHE
ncbi:MAG: sulfatase [Leptospira sp.]|nr:sulfatase [Leptospira sp.]